MPSETCLSVQMWPLDRVKPYSKNARKIPQSAIDKVAQSLREFGWRQPIVVEVQRWQKLSGAEAVLDGDGRTFAEVAAARARCIAAWPIPAEDPSQPPAPTSSLPPATDAVPDARAEVPWGL